MPRPPTCAGQVTYELEAFCQAYGHPRGKVFTVEVTYNAATYVYDGVTGTVDAGLVVFDLHDDDLVETRKAH